MAKYKMGYASAVHTRLFFRGHHNYLFSFKHGMKIWFLHRSKPGFLNLWATQGVVGWERVGTAFPHLFLA